MRTADSIIHGEFLVRHSYSFKDITMLKFNDSLLNPREKCDEMYISFHLMQGPGTRDSARDFPRFLIRDGLYLISDSSLDCIDN